MSPKDPLARYDVVEDELSLGPNLTLRIARVRDVNVLVDAITELDEDERLPYWACLWASAHALSRHLVAAAHPPTRVLELGAGLGLPSITAARLGHRVLATDYEADALAFLERNAQRNQAVLETLLLDLRRPPALERFPLILASDVLYEARQVLPLVAAVLELLEPRGTLLLSDPRRPHLTSFRTEMEGRGFACTEYPADDAMILQFRRTT